MHATAGALHVRNLLCSRADIRVYAACMTPLLSPEEDGDLGAATT
jgi:hypothetical protein